MTRLLAKKYPSYRIIILDKLTYCSTVNNVAEVLEAGNVSLIQGDINERYSMKHILEAYQVDTILHFAAQTHVDNSFGNGLHFTQDNVLGTHVLLECARNCSSIRRFIHVSTDEVRGEEGFYSPGSVESRLLSPTNPYAATKAAAELLATSYLISYKLPVIITRSNNVYGPMQFPEKVIPKFCSLLKRGLPIPIHGDGSNKRTYLHVDDVARAFDAILHQGAVGKTYNIGIETERSNLEVARHLIALYGLGSREEELLQFVSDRKFNDKRYFIDPSDTIALGWQPEVEWKAGLEATKAWYDAVDIEAHWSPEAKAALVAHPRLLG